MTVETITLGDIRMRYMKFGTGGDVLVILPGLSIKPVTESGAAVEQGFEMFTKKYTVYLFDRRINPPTGYSINDMADDTVMIMNHLGILKADIFGASQGGMIGLVVAQKHPELVNKLVAASTLSRVNPLFDDTVQKWLEPAKAGDLKKLSESMTELIYSEKTLEMFKDVILSGLLTATEEEIKDFVIFTEACLGFDCFDGLSEIKCPLLIMGSKGDKVLSPEGAYEIYEAVGKDKAEIYMYDESFGHAVYDEAPDFRERMLKFFEK